MQLKAAEIFKRKERKKKAEKMGLAGYIARRKPLLSGPVIT